jgi:sulfite exporter TauE/SafE
MLTELPAVGGLTVAALWLVFLTGLLSGFGHCIGMCGPIVAAFGFGDGAVVREEGRESGSGSEDGRATPLEADPGLAQGASLAAAGAAVGASATVASPVVAPTASLRPVGIFQVGYQTGRLITYTALGALLGALGGAGVLSFLPGNALVPAQRWLGVFAGLVMVLMGLALLGLPGLHRLGRWVESGGGAASGTSWFSRAAGELARRGAAAAVPLGMLMGLMPCGLLMTIEIRALASGSAGAGALTMLAFGLGTVPALAGFGLASGLLGRRTRGWLFAAGAALVVVLGLLTMARSVAALGLPMPMAG